jgi:hypothetical protein
MSEAIYHHHHQATSTVKPSETHITSLAAAVVAAARCEKLLTGCTMTMPLGCHINILTETAAAQCTAAKH